MPVDIASIFAGQQRLGVSNEPQSCDPRSPPRTRYASPRASLDRILPRLPRSPGDPCPRGLRDLPSPALRHLLPLPHGRPPRVRALRLPGLAAAFGAAWVAVELAMPVVFLVMYWAFMRAIGRVANDWHDCEGSLGKSLGWGALWARSTWCPSRW